MDCAGINNLQSVNSSLSFLGDGALTPSGQRLVITGAYDGFFEDPAGGRGALVRFLNYGPEKHYY